MAESVFIAGMFVKYGKAWVNILRHVGLNEEADAAEQAVAEMDQATLTAGWDGEWFLRAYDANGDPVGSHLCEESNRRVCA